jgi:hypothetical protein
MNALETSIAVHKYWVENKYLITQSKINLGQLLQKVWDTACETQRDHAVFNPGVPGWEAGHIEFTKPEFNIESL